MDRLTTRLFELNWIWNWKQEHCSTYSSDLLKISKINEFTLLPCKSSCLLSDQNYKRPSWMFHQVTSVLTGEILGWRLKWEKNGRLWHLSHELVVLWQATSPLRFCSENTGDTWSFTLPGLFWCLRKGVTVLPEFSNRGTLLLCYD